MIRHRIAQTAAALLIATAFINPAHAQVPVGDGAHIGLQNAQWMEQFVQWGKNLQEWQKDAQRWISSIQSQAMTQVNTTFTDTKAADAQGASLDEMVKKLEAAKPCNKIKDDTAKGLCGTEQAFKIERAKILVDALKNAEKHIDKVNELTTKLNNAIDQGASSASGASDSGGADTKANEVAKIQAEILAEQNKVVEAMEASQEKTRIVDEKIKTVHTVRVDYARTQFEGKEPGLFDKLVSAGSVALALTADEKIYKADIEAIKAKSETGNKY